MANDTEALFTGETTPEPMPSSEQTVEQPSEVVSEAPQEVSETPTKTEELELPSEGVKERTTQQFEKMKEKLAEERTRRMELEKRFQSTESSTVREQEEAPLYDPTTGYVDITQLENMKRNASEAKKVREEFERYKQEQQELEAYAAYPELDPKNKDFDQDFFNMTRAVITDSLINTRDYGNQLTAKQAAELVHKRLSKTVEAVKETAKQEAIEELTPKEQASLEASGNSSNREDDFVMAQELEYRTRRGDKDAIVERLKSIPSV